MYNWYPPTIPHHITSYNHIIIVPNSAHDGIASFSLAVRHGNVHGHGHGHFPPIAIIGRIVRSILGVVIHKKDEDETATTGTAVGPVSVPVPVAVDVAVPRDGGVRNAIVSFECENEYEYEREYQ